MEVSTRDWDDTHPTKPYPSSGSGCKRKLRTSGGSRPLPTRPTGFEVHGGSSPVRGPTSAGLVTLWTLGPCTQAPGSSPLSCRDADFGRLERQAIGLWRPRLKGRPVLTPPPFPLTGRCAPGEGTGPEDPGEETRDRGLTCGGPRGHKAPISWGKVRPQPPTPTTEEPRVQVSGRGPPSSLPPSVFTLWTSPASPSAFGARSHFPLHVPFPRGRPPPAPRGFRTAERVPGAAGRETSRRLWAAPLRPTTPGLPHHPWSVGRGEAGGPGASESGPALKPGRGATKGAAGPEPQARA